MNRFTSGLTADEDNILTHADPITSESRRVVIPCPDFLYCTLKYNLTHTRALKILLPNCEFGNIAFYDNSARCVYTKTLQEKAVTIVLVGPSSKTVDVEEMFAENEKNILIVRLPCDKGIYF